MIVCGKMFEEITVLDVLSNSEKIDGLKSKYIIVFDEAEDSKGFQAMDDAINLMVGKGWKCIDVIFLRGETKMMAHALMERV